MITGATITLTGVSATAFAGSATFTPTAVAVSGTITPGSDTITLTAITEPAIKITGGLTITEEPDTVTVAVTTREPLGLQEPPGLAEIMCIFARTTRAKDIDALWGDFEEFFARDCASGMSRSRAVRRYWARVLRSIGPQILQAIKRVGLLGSLVAAALKR